MQCFGKSISSSRNYKSKTNGENIDNDNESYNSKKSASLMKFNASEKEHYFLRAALNGQFQKIKELVESNMDVNSCNSNGLNALHLASKGGHIKIVEYLLNNGAHINLKTRKDNTALHIASLAGSFEVVKLLIERGASVNDQSQNGFTPLYMAAQENHVNVVKYLLDAGADINLTTDDHFTPLAVAIQQGNDDTVGILLNHVSAKTDKSLMNGIKPESTPSRPSPSWWDPKLPPPLHIATRKDDFNAVLLLLHHQQDISQAITQTSANGFTALHVAAYYGSVKVARLLLENNAPPDMASKNSVTALHVAAKWGQLQVVYLLLEFKAQVDSRTRDGLTPLHCAAREGHKDICEVLIKSGSDFTIRTKSGLTALHLATQNNSNIDLVKMFVTQYKIDPNATSLDYLTPLHFSSHSNTVGIGKVLLSLGAYLNSRAMNGFTPMHVSVKRKHVEFVQMLLALTSSSNQKSMKLVDIQTENGFSPIHIATIVNSIDLVNLLVKYDAEIDMTDDFGRNALQLAAIFDRHDILLKLINSGSNVNWINKIGETASLICVKRSNKLSLELLLRNSNVNLSLKDNWNLSALDWSIIVLKHLSDHPIGNQAQFADDALAIFDLLLNELKSNQLHQTDQLTGLLAVESGNIGVVQQLLQHAMLQFTELNRMNIVHIAAKSNNTQMLDLIQSQINVEDASKSWAWRPEHFAAYYGNNDSLKWFLRLQEDGLNVLEFCVTPRGNTCLHLAVQQLHIDVIQTILQYDIDPQQCNKDGISVLDLVSLIDDESITKLFQRKFPFFKDNYSYNSVKEMTREEPLEEEMLERLLNDIESEIDFYGPTKNSEEDLSEIKKTVQSFLEYNTSSDSIRRQDWSLRANDSLCKYKKVTLMDTAKKNEFALCSQPDSLFSTLSSTLTAVPPIDSYFDDGGFDVEKLDRYRVTDRPVNSGFLVSFLVDARGGCLKAQRFPKMRIYVPPDAALEPTRIIFRLIKPDTMSDKPNLSDCHGFACRILQVHSSTLRFQKPILIEMPYIASLNGNNRQLIVLGKNFSSHSWKEHSFSMDDTALKESFGSYYDSLRSEEELKQDRVYRIATKEIPNYFALVSVYNRDKSSIGQEGGSIQSTINPLIRVEFPQGCLMKKIPISLEVQDIPSQLVDKITGVGSGVSVTPIVTVEPKRRKFRNLITLHMPLPKTTVTTGDMKHLRILFSISENDTKWDDVTDATEMIVTNGNVTYSTRISARVWLIYAESPHDPIELAERIYRACSTTPYYGRFLAFARRHDQDESQLRCLVLTDDSSDKTLECQESFQLVQTGPEVEVDSSTKYRIESAGNLIPITKSDEILMINAVAFQENRLTFTVRTRNPDDKFQGKLAFFPTSQQGLAQDQLAVPITTLDIVMPDEIVEMDATLRRSAKPKKLKKSYLEEVKGCSDPIARTELDLHKIADSLGSDWYRLVKQLKMKPDEVAMILQESIDNSDVERAFLALQTWQNSLDDDLDGSGNILCDALRNIGREDIIKSCLEHIELVEDEQEAALARLRLDSKKESYEIDRPLPKNYTESVDESMIVETGDDDWSEQQRLSEDNILSDISDKKSQHSYNDEILEPSLEEIINMNKYNQTDELSTQDKVDAYLTLTNELESAMEEPVLLTDNDTGKYDDNQPIIEDEMPVMYSCVPTNIKFGEDEDENGIDDMNKIKPKLSMEVNSCVPSNIDFDDADEEEFLKPALSTKVSASPKLITSEMESSTDDPTPQHSVVHEVYDSEPEIQKEIEEIEETLEDGSILKKRLIRTTVTQKSMEKTTKFLTGDEARRVLDEAKQAIDSDGDVVVEIYEEVLPDGTKLERQVHTRTTKETKTLRETLEDYSSATDKEHQSQNSPMEFDWPEIRSMTSVASDDKTSDFSDAQDYETEAKDTSSYYSL